LLNTSAMRSALVSLFLAGCLGNIVPLYPGVEPTTGGSPDLGGGRGGGGGDAAGSGTPQNVTFSDVTADLDGKSCTAACHANPGLPTTTLHLIPRAMAAGDKMANYTKLSALARSGAQSSLLVGGLPGATPAHTGAAYFTGTDDALYKKWLKWYRGRGTIGPLAFPRVHS
jgi:hypothetical protein